MMVADVTGSGASRSSVEDPSCVQIADGIRIDPCQVGEDVEGVFAWRHWRAPMTWTHAGEVVRQVCHHERLPALRRHTLPGVQVLELRMRQQLVGFEDEADRYAGAPELGDNRR